MRVLLDTHTLLWFLQASPSLSGTACSVIRDPSNHKLVSIASCWEMAIKAGLRKLGFVEPVGAFLSRELAVNNFDVLDITLIHATYVETLPQYHKDPFDRLLISQALLDGIPVVSIDVAFDPYGIIRIW